MVDFFCFWRSILIKNILWYNEDCNEDARLESQHGQVEFLTTTKYIEKYLKSDSKILEVGAGTGRYSLYYANKGYDVTSIEYVKHNLDILKSKIKDGIIAIAYLTSDSIMIDWALMGDHLLDGYSNDFDNNFKLTRYPQGVFAPFYISEFKSIMNKFDIELLHNVATDGFTHYVKDKIDSLSKEEFDVWMRYHLSTCEREDLQGYSNHMLYICKK